MTSLSNATVYGAHGRLRNALWVGALVLVPLLVTACGDEVTSDHCSVDQSDASWMDASAFDAGPVDASFDASLCIICTAGQTLCDGVCIDTQANNDNCGGCGIACGTGETCTAGACICGTEMGTAGSGPICTSMSDGGVAACCSDTCVDLNTEPSHCGACGTTCNPGEGCDSGACTCGSDMGMAGSGPICTSSCFSSAGASTLCSAPTTDTTCSCETSAGTDAGI